MRGPTVFYMKPTLIDGFEDHVRRIGKQSLFVEVDRHDGQQEKETIIQPMSCFISIQDAFKSIWKGLDNSPHNPQLLSLVL